TPRPRSSGRGRSLRSSNGLGGWPMSLVLLNICEQKTHVMKYRPRSSVVSDDRDRLLTYSPRSRSARSSERRRSRVTALCADTLTVHFLHCCRARGSASLRLFG